MDIRLYQTENGSIAEVVSDGIAVRTAGDALDAMGELTSLDADRVILHRENITPEFFDLRTGLAGEILQKFVNYRVKVAIVGDFSDLTSRAMQDFIRESNEGKEVNFLPDTGEAVAKLSAAK